MASLELLWLCDMSKTFHVPEKIWLAKLVASER